MSQMLSHLEERQRKISSSMGFVTPEPEVYPPLPPPTVEDPWAWYRNGDDDGEDDADYEIEKESERRHCFSFSLFWCLMPKEEKKFYLLYLFYVPSLFFFWIVI
jgi:hypothetical protein